MTELQPMTNAGHPPNSVLGGFDEFERRGEGSTPSWLQALHKGGIAHFGELGFPSTDQEEWRFTNTAPLAKLPFQLAEPPPAGVVKEEHLSSYLFAGLGGRRLVFIDGRVSKELSSKDLASTQGLKVVSLAEAARSTFPALPQHLARYARYDNDSFVAMNTAFLSDGAVIMVSAGQALTEPIHLLHLSTASRPNLSTHPRTLVIAQRGSQVKIVETFASLGGAQSFTNAVAEIVVEEDAHVEHCKIQLENLQTWHIATLQSYQSRKSVFISHSIAIGSGFTRNNINCALEGEGAEATLNGLYLGRETQLIDHHTAIFHNQPNCNSHEFYHGILDGRSQGVFNGKIFVRPEAQKTDAKQTNRNLLLCEEATVHTKPQLEIFADDVRCTHGATVGQLDPESIFYLRARGIGLEMARKMLLHAFASEIVNRISLQPVRDSLDAQLFEMYEK